MLGREGWGRVVRVVVVVAVGEVCGVSLQDAFAEHDHARRRWHTPEELIQQGQLAAPAFILEVHLAYDADAAPSLRVKRAVVKEGYAPQYEPLDAGYALSLHAERGDTLSSLIFRIPNQVFNPPPEHDEPADDSPVTLRAVEFAITVPMVPEAVTVRVADPQGLLLIEESIRGAPRLRHQRRFRSRPTASSSSWDWLIPSAEAAADNAMLDVTFVGDRYGAGQLQNFYQDVDRVIAHLMTYEPYASRADRVVFHSVDNTAADLGCVHDAATTRLIVCNQAAVTSVVNDAGAPYDKIIVLVNDSAYGGSGGTNVTVSYNGVYAPQVAVHEFGHTLAGLLDEYNLYSTSGPMDGRTYANCYAGSPPNAGWDGVVAASEYVQGCKYPNWYRSSSCSIMKSISCQSFNAVSQRQLGGTLDFYAGSATPTVTFSADPALIGQGGSSTLSWSGTNVTVCSASGGWSGARPASGSESVNPAATATYALACEAAAGQVTVTVDAQAPSVTLTAPSGGTIVSGIVTLSASATDDQGLNRVDFYEDSVLVGSDNTPPFGASWNTGGESAATHSLSARALDLAGNATASAPVVVTVAAADTQPPTVTILSPAGGSQVSGKVQVAASAADNVAVTRLKLLIDGSLKTSSTTGSIAFTWNTAKIAVKPGAHTMTAKAYDAAGNVTTTSVTVFK